MLIVHPNAGVLAETTAARLLISLADAQAAGEEAAVALTGGGIGTKVLVAIRGSALQAALDWRRVHIWWGDDRYVAAEDGDRNELQARQALLDHLEIPAANCHPMPAAVPGQDLEGATAEFGRTYADLAPRFDVVMLGIGPDGHVASLFPGHDTLGAAGDVVAEPDSPKPPPQRISLTLPAINSAREVWVIASGAEKADAVALARTPGSDLPAARVHGTEQTLWLIDRDAAGTLV